MKVFCSLIKKCSLLTAVLCFGLLQAAEPKIKYGISEMTGAIGKRTDFQLSPLAEFYRGVGVEATYIPTELFHKRGITRTTLDKTFKEFHVLNIRPFGEGVGNYDQDLKKSVKITSEALQDYVKSGGSLIIQIRPSRYSSRSDALYWNDLFAPFGLQIDNNHGLTSTSTVNCFEKPGWVNDFFYTDNIVKHEITKDVTGLWLPVNSYDRFPGTPVIKYSPEFEILVRTGKDGGTFFSSETSRTRFIAGRTKIIPAQEPLPIIAYRKFGKGYVISVPVDMIHTGLNFRNPVWGNITEEKGLNGKPSHLMNLMKNAVLFAAQPALKNPELGTYQAKKITPIQFPEAVYWNKHGFLHQPGELVYGIVGAHTNYSDGKSTVEEYVKSAKKAGLSFIVFADPVEKLTPETTEKIKEECKKFTDDTFFACPGLEFTDRTNLKRFVYGLRVKHPGNTSYKTSLHEHKTFDGKIILNSGYFIGTVCSFAQNGFLDAKDFERNPIHPENLWWFWAAIPYVHDNGKLVADNRDFFRNLLDDIRAVVPITFNRIYSADDVEKSKNTAVMGGYSLPQVVKYFNSGSGSGYWAAERGNLFCSYNNGGSLKVKQFRFINLQEDPRRLHTRGTQRVRGLAWVESPNGIKEVRVMDRNQKPVRIFDGKGKTVLKEEFELVHDKQYYLYLEVEDMKGGHLISNFARVYDYKQGLYRCSDNMNILGPLGICWHPNWPEKISLFKYFRNSEILSVQGWDRASGDCPRPQLLSDNTLLVEGKGNVYPSNRETTDGVVMDIKLNGGDLQIVESMMDEIVENFGNAKRGRTTTPCPPQVLAKNEYFAHHQRVYYFRDRQDFHIAWDHRRLRESLLNYDGAMCLVTGEITFRKDVKLSSEHPIPFILGQTRIDPNNIRSDAFWIIKDKEKGLIAEEYKQKDRKQFVGQLTPGSFATSVWSPLGTLAIFPLSNTDWRYRSISSCIMSFGVGTPGKEYKAGESIKYAYVSANVISDTKNPEKYQKLSDLIQGKYPQKVVLGKKISEPLFFHVEADGNEAKFEVGPEKGLGIDLPIKVSKLQDNGCVAIYSTKRPHFRFIGIADGENTAYTQEPMDEKNQIWIGNIFVADHKDLRLTFVADGQAPNAVPFLEIHNPTGKEIKAVITSPRNTPQFGGTSFRITVPAKGSVKYKLQAKK